MEKLNVWSRQIRIKLQENNEHLYKSDYKFFKLDRLEKIAVKIDEFSDTCEDCVNIKNQLENLIGSIPEMINGSPSERRNYEKQNESFMKHLTKKHGITQDGYYVAVYTFWGIMAGIILIGGISYYMLPSYIKLGIMSGFVIGIISGRLYGKNIDKKNKKEGLVL